MRETQRLSSEERAELEALRAEKAAREAELAAAERAELQALRAELSSEIQPTPSASSPLSSSAAVPQLDQDHSDIPETRAAKMMQPDKEDLTMAPAQKILIFGGLAIVLLYVLVTYVF